MRMPKPFYRRQTRSWYVQIGKRQINLGPDKDKATEKYHTLMIGKQGAGTDLTVATLVKLFLLWNQDHRGEGTQRFYSRPLLSFVEHVGVKLRVADVKKRTVEDWIDHKFLKGSNPNYKRNWLRAVVRLFNWAIDKEHITHSPVQRLKKPAAKPRDEIITTEQWQTLVGVLKQRGTSGEALLDLVTLMRLTGCRPLEARSVEARHLDRPARCLVFERELSKGETDEETVERRVVPLTDEAFALCSRLALKHPSGPLFLRWTGKPWTNKDLKNYFRRLTTPMPRKDRTGKKYKSTPALDFHMTAYTIRHTWATDALVRGVDMATVATIMGHKDTTQLMNTYQHIKLKSDHVRAMLHVAVGEQPAPSPAPVALTA